MQLSCLLNRKTNKCIPNEALKCTCHVVFHKNMHEFKPKKYSAVAFFYFILLSRQFTCVSFFFTSNRSSKILLFWQDAEYTNWQNHAKVRKLWHFVANGEHWGHTVSTIQITTKVRLRHSHVWTLHNQPQFFDPKIYGQLNYSIKQHKTM